MKTLKTEMSGEEGSVWLTHPVGGIKYCLKAKKKNEKML